MSQEKLWGSEPFWGLSYARDPDWMSASQHKELRAEVIELCEQKMCDKTKRCGDELKFPRRNLEPIGR